MASSASVVFFSALKGSSELLLNVVLSGVLEAVFPPFDAAASPWVNLLEGTLEIALYLLVAGTASNALGEMIGEYGLARLPYGSLLMFWLCENAVLKLGSFVGYIKTKMNQRRARLVGFEAPADGDDTELHVDLPSGTIDIDPPRCRPGVSSQCGD